MDQTTQLYEIQKARAGDETALARLIAQQMPAIRSMAAQAVCPGLDFDDAVQEGTIALVSALKTFDAAKGAGFRTYANACIHHAITDAARKASRAKHAPLNNSIPLPDAQSTPGPEETVLATEAYTQHVHNIHSRLSRREKQVLALFLENATYAQIANTLGIDEKAVDNAIQRVRAKLK